MGQIIININDREYAVGTEDGQEGHILALSRILDEKARSFGDIASQVSESQILALVGLLLADELSELKKKKASQSEENNPVDNSGLAAIDELLSGLIKQVSEDIKSLANKIELL